MSFAPDLSVVIPAYNAAETILYSLESVRRQTNPPLEVIVVDDGSADSTSAVVSSYLQENALTNWRLLRQANSGAARARDVGIRSALGSHIALLDADDVWLPERLVSSTRLLTLHRLDLLGARLLSTAANDECRMVDRRAILFSNPFFTSTTVFSRAAYLEVGGFDRAQRYSEDYKLWLAFAWHGKRCGLMDRPYAIYRPHSMGANKGLSSQRWKMQLSECRNFQWLYRSGLAPMAWCLAAQAFSWMKFARRLSARP